MIQIGERHSISKTVMLYKSIWCELKQLELLARYIQNLRAISNCDLKESLDWWDYLSSYQSYKCENITYRYIYREAASRLQVSWFMISIKWREGRAVVESTWPIQSRESSHEITVTPQRKIRRWNCNQFCINNPSSLSRYLLCEYLRNTFTKLEIKCFLRYCITVVW